MPVMPYAIYYIFVCSSRTEDPDQVSTLWTAYPKRISGTLPATSQLLARIVNYLPDWTFVRAPAHATEALIWCHEEHRAILILSPRTATAQIRLHDTPQDYAAALRYLALAD